LGAPLRTYILTFPAAVFDILGHPNYAFESCCYISEVSYSAAYKQTFTFRVGFLVMSQGQF
jgi:hypothetical protein